MHKVVHHIRKAHKAIKLRRQTESNLNTFLVVVAIVLIWRGVWWLVDIYVLPHRPVLSLIIGLFVGIIILYLDDKKIKELY